MINIIDSDRAAIEYAQKIALEFAQHAGERDQQRRLPHEELQRLSASGFLGITVPKVYGGAAVSSVTLAEVIKIISSGDSSIGQIPQGHFYIMEALNHDGTEAQKQRFFKLALEGQLFGNAFAETGTKTVAECKTRITRSPTGYVINGRKFYSTGALFAQWIGVVGLDENDTLLMAIAKRDTPGLTILDDWSARYLQKVELLDP